ncbi:protein of unknown function [Kyrpidia spormannii]|uniref:Uncharacterized protein n=2 Tax=Kyrpidia spormannii TaxID=2055160 RepID=A0ACA8Z8D3_9BACL|nr:protein of unknown function [Kyrpidia spormannii]CAB3392747.1 protein of unknown function [Kyrpidia spormannii]
MIWQKTCSRRGNWSPGPEVGNEPDLTGFLAISILVVRIGVAGRWVRRRGSQERVVRRKVTASRPCAGMGAFCLSGGKEDASWTTAIRYICRRPIFP